MRVLVCGGRDYSNRARVFSELRKLADTSLRIIHGGATGADAFAAEFASRYSIPAQGFPADWEQHGRAAGPVRNKKMLTEGKPNLVLAFPGGPGTANMVALARKAGIEVKVIED